MILSIDFRTDIPAFYSKWIVNRFKEGFLYFRNPGYPKRVHKVILDKSHVEGIIWCSKNYAPLMSEDLKSVTDNFPSIFHYTVTNYGKDIEPGVPNINKTIDTFKRLSSIYGKERVIWRYDPIFFDDDHDYIWHWNNFNNLVSELHDYTDRVVINFASIYEKVKRHMPSLVEITNEDKLNVVKGFLHVCQSYGLKLQTCGNGLQFKDLPGVEVTGCLDENALHLMNIWPKEQKKSAAKCGCLCYPNTSVGEYNTCLHKCKYCYATSDFDRCDKNFKMHDDNSPLLIGWPEINDYIIEMKPKILNTRQLKLF